MRQSESTKTYKTPGSELALPEVPEIERAVLGALILEPAHLPDVMEIVKKDAFHEPDNGKIYDAMISMFEQGERIDIYTLAQRCKGAYNINNAAAYIVGLTQSVGSGDNVIAHAKILKYTETRRRLVLFANELLRRAISDPDGVLDWALEEVTSIAAQAAGVAELETLAEVANKTLADLEVRQKIRQAGGCVGIPTGLQRLDAITGGWRGGQLVVLAGRPAMGKSAVMIHIAMTAAVSGIPVCIYSLEMPNTQLAGRILVGESGVEPVAFRVGNVGVEDWAALEQTGANLSAMPVYLNDTAQISMNTIRSQCKVMKQRGQCGLILIDYLQLLDTSTGDRNGTREREIAAASRSAKLLAKELDVPVILLSQLSRKVEERADKTPLLSDLRESGAIEQDADIVVFIDRPAVYGIMSIETSRHGVISSEGVGVLHIAKNREGDTGRIYFRHNPSMTRITDYDGFVSGDKCL